MFRLPVLQHLSELWCTETGLPNMSTIEGRGGKGRGRDTSTVFTTALGSRLGWGWSHMTFPLIATNPQLEVSSQDLLRKSNPP